MHRHIRWTIQVLFLVFFIMLFLQTRYGMRAASQTLFFKFDPLVLIFTSLAARTLIGTALPAVAILILTLVFGRFFCGFACPLGTTLDIFERIISREPKHPSKNAPQEKLKSFRSHNIKYFLLVFLLLAALLGASFVHFFDPLAIFERTLTFVVFPVATFFAALFTNLNPFIYTETLIALAFIVALMMLGLIAPRFWCRSLCPLGGVLGFISRFSLFKFTILKNCTTCMICEGFCPTGAIDSGKKELSTAECIACLRCQYECPTQMIKYKTNLSFLPFDIRKRHFITAAGTAIIIAPLARSLVHRKLEARLLRPPGSIPEEDFLNTCIHCGKCQKACPTNGLQPCVLESGINGLWTPRLVPRVGGCENNCNMCGQVCPTSAVRKLSLEEKTYARIGTAVIDRDRCIAWEQNKVCLICDEACPFNAIIMQNEPVQDVLLGRPFIDERICTGCGICEARCPIEGSSAIQVFPMGEERKKTGSYITEEKVRLRSSQDRPDNLPSGFIIEDN